MRKLICKTGAFAGREFDLAEGVLRAGRNPENELHIEEPSVSGFHCELQVAEIGLAVRDLNSTNGTFINHKQVAKGIIHSGDTLTLGEIDFAVQLPDVHIALPELQTAEPVGAGFLEDGSPACWNHREAAALFRCTKCENWWCGDCVRSMKRLSGQYLLFCPECSAACEPVQYERAEKKSFLTRVSETIRLPRKK